MAPRYEFGRIFSTGMIGNIYIAKAKESGLVVAIK
jgi:hypothetical protein